MTSTYSITELYHHVYFEVGTRMVRVHRDVTRHVTQPRSSGPRSKLVGSKTIMLG